MSEADLRPWEILSRTPIHDSPWVSLSAERCRLPNGHILEPYYRISMKHWACVAALTPRDTYVMVEQYRFGVDRVVLELPAGDIDDDEHCQDAALREFQEETGYLPDGEVTALGALATDTSHQDTLGHGFFVSVSGAKTEQKLDISESIRVCEMNFDEILAAYSMGRFCHAHHMAFLLLAERQRKL